jgi:hypothetical protein
VRTITWSPLVHNVRTLHSSVSSSARCSRVTPGWAGAGRPSADGRLTRLARGRAVQTGRSAAARSNRGYVWYENEHSSPGHTQSLRGCAAPVVLSASNPWLAQFKLARQFSKPKRCGLTLPSSGRPPAWPAKLLRLLFRSAGQSGARLSCQTLGRTQPPCVDRGGRWCWLRT